MVQPYYAGGSSLKTFAKVLIMLVRLIAVLSIVFGVMIWAGTGMQFVGAHIGLGFIITLLVGILAVLALVRRLVPLGILGLVVVTLLPYIGLKQFPLAMRPHIGAMQIAHIVIVLATLGIAEAMNGKIQKS